MSILYPHSFLHNLVTHFWLNFMTWIRIAGLVILYSWYSLKKMMNMHHAFHHYLGQWLWWNWYLELSNVNPKQSEISNSLQAHIKDFKNIFALIISYTVHYLFLVTEEEKMWHTCPLLQATFKVLACKINEHIQWRNSGLMYAIGQITKQKVKMKSSIVNRPKHSSFGQLSA
jgi:hypothetical protein